MEPTEIDINYIVKAFKIELKPAIFIVSVIGLSFYGETIWRQRSQKDAIKVLSNIFINNVCYSSQACGSGSHECADLIFSKARSYALDGIDRTLIRIISLSWSIRIV